ncbi:MAG: T9SS type A sorting domain-containing protein [Ignavibacteria bacterium]|nr:T9SS type A sorting domain-containing protein [Ignavibacteria bacterium]
MKYKILIFVLQLSLTIPFSFSQVSQEWAKIFQGNSGAYVEARDFQKDISGNLIISGYTASGNNADFLILKYDSYGQLIFSTQFDSTSEGAWATTSDNLGNIYVTGDISVIGGKILTLKYDPIGNLLWKRVLNPVNFGSMNVIDIKWHNENLYLAGNVSDQEGYDTYITKYDNSGNQLWFKRYNSPNDSFDFAKELHLDQYNNIYICGTSFVSIDDDDYLLAKFDSNGNLIWDKVIDDGNAENVLTSTYLDELGNIYLTGSSNGKYFTVKYNSLGSELWRRFYSGPEGGSEPQAIWGDKDHNIYVTGFSKDSTIINFNIATLKYSPSGDSLWSQRYSGPGLNWDKPLAIAIDRNDNVYVTGYITNLNDQDFITLKYDKNGVFKWDQSYNSGGFDVAFGITCDDSGNVYICGNSSITGGSSSIRTIKYSQPNAISNISSQIPTQFSLSQNYPNPFNPVTKIKFQIPLLRGVEAEGGRGVFVKISVHDILGREVAVLVNEQLRPGTYEVDWDASAFPSGVYFYSITSGSFKETRKMVLLK